MRDALARLRRDTAGASAVEFAIVAPILCLGLLVVVDIGMAVTTRMELDRNVRAGAQAAISLNNDASAIAGIVRAAAGSPRDLTVNVGRSCQCAGAASGCSALCASGEPPSVYFTIDAQRPQPGLILGERTITSGARVQLR